MKYFLGISSFALATATGGPACAQGPANEAASAKPEAVALEGGDIVVTARKRGENLVDVPVSITAVSGAKLDQLAIRDVQQAAKLVPNVYIDRAGAGPRLSIRGIGNGQTGGVIDSSVGLAIDGLFYSRPRWLDAGLFDLQSIEVLRGPQSTYFGKNTTAGLLNIHTRDPGTAWEGYAQVGAELEHGGYDGEFAAGGPLSDNLGIRVAYRHNQTDGYLEDLSGGRDQPRNSEDIVRLTLTSRLGADITANYKFTYFHSVMKGNAVEIGACSPAFKAELAAMGSPEDCKLNYRKTIGPPIPGGIVPGPEGTRNEGQNHVFSFSSPVGTLTLSSVTGYNKLTNQWVANGNYTSVPTFRVSRPELYEQFSQELRLQSPATERVSYIFGLYYDHFKRGMSQIVDGPGFGNISFNHHLGVTGDDYAAFGEITGRITPELSLVAGGRYTVVDQKGNSDQVLGTLGLGVIFPAPFSYNYTDKLNEKKFTPEVTLQYKPNTQTNFYASFKKGFKAGGFDLDGNTAQNAFHFDAETAQNYEAGVKLELLDRRLLLTMAGFHTVAKNLQVQSYTATEPTATILNAAAAKVDGAEFEASLRVTTEFNVNLNAGYANSRYTSFPNAPCTQGQVAGAAHSATVCNPTQDLSGGRLPLAPRFSGSVGTDWTHPVSSSYNLAVSATATFRSSVFLGIEDDPFEISNSLTLVDARLALQPAGRQGLSLAVVGRNLFDKKYSAFANAEAGNTAGSGVNSWAYGIGVPRTVEIQIRYGF